MKKLGCCLLCCILLGGCFGTSNQKDPQRVALESQVIEMQAELNQLEETLDECQGEIASMQVENKQVQERLAQNELAIELFPVLSNLSLDFVRAHTTGDMKRLLSLVGEPIQIRKEGGFLLGTWEEDGQEIEWELWRDADSKVYQDMVIQGFGILENGRYVIHIREFYTEFGVETSPPTFLNLHFQEVGNQWKIVYFEFDV